MDESVHFLEKALEFFLRDCPSEMHENAMNIYVLMGVSHTRKYAFEEACGCYHKALNVSKALYGEGSEEAAHALV